jgi:hypothetical protein
MWKKILLGIAIFIALIIALSLFLTRGLADVANKQLEALRKGDVTAAYSYTAKDFQHAVSMQNFEKFLDQYPALKNNQKSSWSERSTSNGIGTLKGTLTATDGGVTPVEYHFVKENNEWKVLSITLNKVGTQILADGSSSQNVDKTQGEIYQVLVSDVQGSKRSVDKGKETMPTTAKKIYASVYIMHAKKGVKVAAQLVRLENKAKIGPSVATVSQTGNVIRDFSFTNTDPSWPKGDYVINVLTSNGQVATVKFKIE